MSSRGEETSREEAFNMQALRQHLERIEICFDQVLDRMEKNEAEVQKMKRDVPQGRIIGNQRGLWKRRPKRRVIVETRLKGISGTMIGRIET